MTFQEMRIIVNRVSFWNYAFKVEQDGERRYLQASYLEADIVTTLIEKQSTRKWMLSEHMTVSELVQTCFKCVMTSMEHRAREGFTYKGSRVFGPHFDVEALVELCKARRLDYRKPETLTGQAALDAAKTAVDADIARQGRQKERG